MCVLSGCDYLDNVKGIGIKKVLEVFKGEQPKKRMDELLARYLEPDELEEYRANVERTCLCFTNQLVYFDQGKKESDRLVPVNPLSAFQNLVKHGGCEDYTGKLFKNADSYSRGEREFQNHMEVRTVEKIDFDQLIRFYSYIPRTECGFLSNLTTRTVGMSNFQEFGTALERSDDEEYYRNLQKTREDCRKRSQERVQSRLSMTTGQSVISFSTAVSRRTKILKTGLKGNRNPFIAKRGAKRSE